MSQDDGFCTDLMRGDDAQTGFTCGVRALDDYFARHAWPNMTRGLGRTWVYRGDVEAGDPPILAFYTLSMAAADTPELRAHLGGRLPRYPVPVALLGRLGVHVQGRGRGTGLKVIRDAFRRIHAAAAQVGCAGVLVDAKDAGAAAWYGRLGFVDLGSADWPRPMFLPQSHLAALPGA